MNTTAVNNPLAVLQAPVANSKQDAAPAPEGGSFNQVLSREMAGRGNTANNANEASKNPGKDTANQGDKSKTETGPATSEVAKTTEDGKVAAPEAKAEEGDDAPVTVSAELLAFVAALTQANTAATAAPVASADAELGVAVKGDAELKPAVDTKLGANPLTASADSEKEAVGKKSDFVAALDKASKGSDDGKNAATATPAKTGIELATAVAQGAKALEPAGPTVTNPQNVAAVTAAALQQLSDAQGPQSNKIAPQVGNPGWDQAIGQKVLWMVQGAQQSATLTLNPPDLGPMQVTVQVNNNQATANFTAHQPEVRHALEAAMPRLREMLNDAGIQLGQSNVSAGTPNQQGSFGEQRQSSGSRASHQPDSVDAAHHVSHIPLPASGNGLVDTFA